MYSGSAAAAAAVVAGTALSCYACGCFRAVEERGARVAAAALSSVAVQEAAEQTLVHVLVRAAAFK